MIVFPSFTGRVLIFSCVVTLTDCQLQTCSVMAIQMTSWRGERVFPVAIHLVSSLISCINFVLLNSDCGCPVWKMSSGVKFSIP